MVILGFHKTKDSKNKERVRKVLFMISIKSKFKVLYPILIVELILAILSGYFSTVQQPLVLKSIEELFSITLSLVICFKLLIIFFSFNYREKSGAFQQATFTLEQIFQLVLNDYYKRAVALDKKKNTNEV